MWKSEAPTKAIGLWCQVPLYGIPTKSNLFNSRIYYVIFVHADQTETSFHFFSITVVSVFLFLVLCLPFRLEIFSVMIIWPIIKYSNSVLWTSEIKVKVKHLVIWCWIVFLTIIIRLWKDFKISGLMWSLWAIYFRNDFIFKSLSLCDFTRLAGFDLKG